MYLLKIGYCKFHRELLRPEYGDSKRGQWRGGGEKTAPIKKLNNGYLYISLSFSFPFGFVFHYKIFARTEIATNQMRIHVALKFATQGVT